MKKNVSNIHLWHILEKLVIEVNGPIHGRIQQKENDLNRTAEMEQYDIKVIRFTNDEVNNHIQKVMQKIRKEITSYLNE